MHNLQGEGKGDSLEGVCEWEKERMKTFPVWIGIWKCIIVEYLKRLNLVDLLHISLWFIDSKCIMKLYTQCWHSSCFDVIQFWRKKQPFDCL